MKTKIIHLTQLNSKQVYKEAAKTLRGGGLVAFPTETVYGIGGNALDSEVVKKIYQAKGRPSDNPLIVHLGHSKEVDAYVKAVPEVASLLMKAFWPGPLTIIFNKNQKIPALITGGLNTVAIRVPNHPVARGIIQASGLPIAAPSANLSGKPSPTVARHVIEDLQGRVDMIIDGGDTSIGLESTVLDLTAKVPLILRPGSITKAMLEQVVGKVTYDPHLLSTSSKEAPKSPGMKYRHYAPQGQLKVFKGEDHKVLGHINEEVKTVLAQGLKPGVIAATEDVSHYECEIILTIGSKNNPEEVANNLFKVLRKMDDLGVDVIFTRSLSEKAIGTATMNRLLKAAGNQLIIF